MMNRHAPTNIIMDFVTPSSPAFILLYICNADMTATMAAMAIAYGLESIATRSFATAFDTRPVAVASLILAAISRFDIAMEMALALVSDISADTILGNPRPNKPLGHGD